LLLVLRIIQQEWKEPLSVIMMEQTN